MKNGLIPVVVPLLTGFLFLGGCGDHAVVKSAQHPAAQALLEACPGLQSNAADVILGSAELKPADMTIQRERGWSEVTGIVVHVSEKPSQHVAADIKATGNRCYFDIGPDMKTVAVTKRACMALCKDQSFDRITDNPYMAYFGTDGNVQYMR